MVFTEDYARVAMTDTGPTVLVVEDDPDVRDLIVEILDAEGLNAVGDPDIASAVHRVTGAPPDAAVIDYALPDGVGTDLCKILRGRRVPCMILSAYPRPDTTEARAQPWMQKPFSVPVLAEAVRTLLVQPPAPN